MSKGRDWLRGTSLALTLTWVMAGVACGGGNDSTAVVDGTTPPDPEPPVETSTAPAVLLAERVDTPETRQIYLHVLPSLPTEPADRSRAYEFGSVYIFTYGGMVYVRDREAGTMTRYRVTDDLELVQDVLEDGREARLSFLPLGLKPFGMPSIFISPTRAYLIDTDDRRVVVWNPTTMELAGTIPIPNADKAGFETGQIRRPVRVDDRVFAGVFQWENYDSLTVHPGTGVMIFSATTDEPPVLLEDSRITGAANLFADAAGDVYVVGTQGSGIYNVLGPAAGSIPPAGILRIKKGATEFDPDFFIDLNEATGSQGIVGSYLVNDTTLALQLWEPGVDVRSQVEVPDDFYNAEEFVYGVVDLTTQTYSPLASIPKAGQRSTQEVHLDDVLYVQTYNQISETVRDAEVHAVSPTGTQRAFSIPGGDLENLDRIR